MNNTSSIKPEWSKPVLLKLNIVETKNCAKTGSFVDAQDNNCTS